MQQRFVSIWFPYLVTDWHARKQASLRQLPFVLKAKVHGRMVITHVNELARKQGISRGMVLADARAIFPGLEALDDKPGLAEQITQRMAEWAIRFTPAASPDSNDGLLLDATGCAHLWGGEERYIQDIRERFQQRGYQCNIGMADTIGAAWAMARYGSSSVVPTGQHSVYMLDWPVSSLRCEAEIVVRLHQLGIRQIRDLVSIPRTALRRRFGSSILNRLDQMRGAEQEIFTPVYPPAEWQERWPCIEPVRTREGIEIALQELLQRLTQKLAKDGKGIRKAVYRIYRMDGHTQGLSIGTHRPVQGVEHLFRLFELKLGELEPAEGIELFQLDATQVEEAQPLQEQLWERKASLQDPELASWLDRMTGKLGAEAIQRFIPAAHYWPERAYSIIHHLDECPPQTWKGERPRPVHLLSHPEPIEVTAPIPDYPPMLFRHKGQLHTITKADGPERIEQEWWIQEGEHRDYYYVEDAQGGRYWLFRSGHYDTSKKKQWFLHGYFA